MRRSVIACALGLLAATGGRAAEVADGIYPLAGRTGRDVKLSGGDWVALGKLRTSTWERAEVWSVANDNSRFEVRLLNVDHAVDRGEPATVVLVVADVGMPAQGQTRHADGRLDMSFTVTGGDDVRKVAAVLKAGPVLRKHPGHRVVLRLTPDKESYRPGEAVTLTADLRNVGDRPVYFRNGGQQRGPRNNQFRFLAYRGYGQGKAVPDTGDPTNFGGLNSVLTLRPGESFSQAVQLDKWFTFAEPDTYRVTGLFELELHDSAGPDGRVIWNDLAAGECLVKVAADKK